MWLTPSSMARRSTPIAASRSGVGPNTPGPGSCIAPKPTRRTARPASGKVSPRPGTSLAGRSQVLDVPIGRRAGGALELIGVGGEVTAGVQLEPLGLAGPVERRQREIGGTDRVVVADDHEQRRRRDPLDEGPRLVLRVQLERSQSYLVAPLLKAPLVLRGRALSGEELPRIGARMRGRAALGRVHDHRHGLGRSAAK